MECFPQLKYHKKAKKATITSHTTHCDTFVIFTINQRTPNKSLGNDRINQYKMQEIRDQEEQQGTGSKYCTIIYDSK